MHETYIYKYIYVHVCNALWLFFQIVVDRLKCVEDPYVCDMCVWVCGCVCARARVCEYV